MDFQNKKLKSNSFTNKRKKPNSFAYNDSKSLKKAVNCGGGGKISWFWKHILNILVIVKNINWNLRKLYF